MKTIRAYNSNSEDDMMQLKRDQKSLDMYCALWALSQAFRTADKHGGPEVTRDVFHDILGCYNIDLDELGN